MSIYDSLNDRQKEAVLHKDGPLLILAGAGSGKTRVLTHRIAWLIEEQGVKPWNILAITFTNKAAAEMRERVDEIVGFGSESVWVSTFHSTCVRILRRYIDRIGYGTNFTIYDSDDQKVLMRDICRRMNLDTKIYKERMLISVISSAKDKLTTPDEFAQEAEGDFHQRTIAKVYQEYQRQLHKNNALDFDDLLMKTVQLFEMCPDVLESYQDRFQYIMVDEYQDTNQAQFRFVSQLAGKHRNLCVVGDDDQSIYKFRGADIKNILNFEDVFHNTRVIRLEQNYRSTSNILDAANDVISNNTERKDKRLWTSNGTGEKLQFQQFQNGFEEAEYVVSDIEKKVSGGYHYRDCAVLYRTNAQSRLFEEKFVAANIPYKIIGGVSFYARKEIKDLLAYLKTIDNAVDDVAVKRIINVPKRGIGQTTISRVEEYAQEQGISFYDALKEAEIIPALGRGLARIRPFVTLIQTLRGELSTLSVSELLEEIISETGYVADLEAEATPEAQARIENIDELKAKVASYEETCEDQPSLSEFLEEVALVADIDSLEEESNYVVLMTLHSAKGLEFPNVYMAGMEDGIFPSYMTINENDPTALEEERRLCYVGITRARENLCLTSARMRMTRGETQYNPVSRFIKEIPEEVLGGNSRPNGEKIREVPTPSSFSNARNSFRSKPFEQKQFKVKKTAGLEYQEGDMVSHLKFGTGVVKQITEGGRDYEVTVEFEQYGVKKMFASFAKLKKV